MTTDGTVQVGSKLEELITTRGSLHGFAECLPAGPEHRATGEIALRVTDDGFATTAAPELRLAGDQVVTAPAYGYLAALVIRRGDVLVWGEP